MTSNTESCDPVNGSCTCKTGWEGDNCSQNKNECTLNTFTCPQNSTCEDTQGSYVCNCDTGFSKSSDEKCQVCDSKYYGQDCATPCPCYAVNTKMCDHVTGYCTCKEGWEDAQCSKDIDECNNGSNACTERFRTVCLNNAGSYSCECNEGFELDDGDVCADINECVKGSDDCLQRCNNTEGSYVCFCDAGYSGSGNDCAECSGNTFGDICNSPCNCTENNTENPSQSCDHVNGTCLCTAYWTGLRCEVDIDECELGTHNCTGDYEGCHNTDAGFTCSCLCGFVRDGDNNCVIEGTTAAASTTSIPDSVQVVNVVLTLDIAVEGNLNVSLTYGRYRLEVQTRLTAVYIEKLNVAKVTITINSLRIGSLVVDYDVVVPKTSLPDVAVVHADIATGNTTMQVFGDTVNASGLVIDNTTVEVGGKTKEEQLCEIFEASAGDCGQDYKCSVSDGLPVCVLRHTEDKLPLILGLGVGIPMFFLCVAAIILCIVYYHHRIRSKHGKIYRYDDESSSSVYQGRIPVRLHTATRGHFYGPQNLPSFPDKNGYGVDSSAHDKFSEDSVYNDNAQTADPENRLTWHFMLGLTQPEEKFHIRRPMVGREQQGQYQHYHSDI